ncbi:MAG: hypothetical protein JJ966_07160 [Balneolaceae bacterium]|nr:hypothetical protein [Balneolaceae bacterium]
MSKVFFSLILVFTFIGSVQAQDSTRTGIKYGFLPLLSFNTDDGVYLGGEVQIYDYGAMLPFDSYTRVNATYRTNGAFGLYMYRDQVRTFGTDVRTGMDVLLSQNFGNYFFGDTEEIEFSQARFDTSKFYSFKSFRAASGISTRFPISFGEGISRFDLKTGLILVYESPWDLAEGSFMQQQKFTGYDGAFLSLMELGLVLERRNNEFVAQRGYKIDVGTKVAPPLISTNVTAENYFIFVGFLPVLEYKGRSLTLASKFALKNTVGDTPYWFLPSLSGSDNIRGVYYRRFSSDNAISYSLEARTWLIPIKYKNINLGLNFFIDGGRVFKNDDWGGILSDHIHSLGLGGVMSIFTPDFILKYEMGFSEIGTGVYLGTGYSF